jgi:hypothetical protein
LFFAIILNKESGEAHASGGVGLSALIFSRESSNLNNWIICFDYA